MADYQTITKYAFIPLVLTVLALAGMNYQPDATHACDSIEKKAYCFALSGGVGTRCYQDDKKESWKNCAEGWKLIPPAPEVEPVVVTQVVETKGECAPCPKAIVLKYYDDGKVICDTNGQNCKAWNGLLG